MDQAISAAALLQQFETGHSPDLPLVLDVRRAAAFISAPDWIAGRCGAIRRTFLGGRLCFPGRRASSFTARTVMR